LQGKTIRQPIGSVNFTATGITINAPATTAQEKITVYGTAKAKSKITVFENGNPVGQTTALGDGTWSLRFALQNTYSFSYHDIHAEIFTDDGVTLITEVKQVLYDASHIELAKITMYNRLHPVYPDLEKTVFDFLNPQNSDHYYYYWTYPEFRFEIEFTQNDPEKVTDVILYVYTLDGKVRSYEPVFDDSLRIWVAVDTFFVTELPVNVMAEFEAEYEVDIDALMNEILNADTSGLTISERTILIDNEEHVRYHVDINNETFYMDYCKFTLQNMNNLIEQIQNFGFIKDFMDGYYSIFIMNNSLILFNIDSLSISSFISSSEIDILDIISLLSKQKKQKSISDFFLSKEAKAVQARRNAVFRKISELENCPKINEEVKIHLTAGQQSVRGRLLWLYSVVGVTEMANLLNKYTITDKYDFSSVLVYELNQELPDKIKLINQLENQVLSMHNPCDEPPCLNPPCVPPPPSPSHPPIPPVLDPSGYVYEAVPSNRLEGVTVTIYYKTKYQDMYGDWHDTIVIWDAENYHQENPLRTNVFGEYMWDVPEGLWQVKYEKEGYETIYSEWLPVPPPQLEVNVGMWQRVQPNVKKVQGYEEGIIVRFDKYMMPDLLNVENVFVRRNGVKEQDSVAMLNAEDNPINAGEQFVSNVRYIPQTPFVLTDTVYLTVKWRVKSYAGTEMGKDTVILVPIEIEPKTLTATQELHLAYNAMDTVFVSVLPAEAGAGKRILLYEVPASSVSIVSDVVLDSLGTAAIPVLGKVSGTTYITVNLEETDLQAEVKVHVDLPIPKLNKPKSSIASETRVNKYTNIALTSNTVGASIYYTTDTVMPLDTSTFILYTDSLPLTQDVTLTAFAKKEGMRSSELAQFVYQVNPTYIVTTSANNSLYGKVTGGGEYNPRQTVHIDAIPTNKHYYFVQWQDGDTINPRIITVTQDTVFVAEFGINQYSIIVNYGTGSGIYNYGTMINIQASPQSGYNFAQWHDGNTDNPRSITVIQDSTFTAEFDVAITEIKTEQGVIRVYPNPTKKQLTIECRDGACPVLTVEIYSVVGQKLMQLPCKDVINHVFTIDVSGLANGMYYLKIDNKVIKFVKE